MKTNCKRMNKIFAKNSEEYKNLDKLFSVMTEEQRLSYIYSATLIQSIIWFLFNRTVGIEKIHHFFISDYAMNDIDKVSLDYMDIAKYYLKKKNGMDIDKFSDKFIKAVSKAYKKDFQSIEEYIEFYVNNKTDDNTFFKVYNFIKTGNEK